MKAGFPADLVPERHQLSRLNHCHSGFSLAAKSEILAALGPLQSSEHGCLVDEKLDHSLGQVHHSLRIDPGAQGLGAKLVVAMVDSSWLAEPLVDLPAAIAEPSGEGLHQDVPEL